MPEEIEVPTEQLQEKMAEELEEAKHEREESKHERQWVARVAVSAALLAVAAAISALLAGHHANEAILEQMQATDQWQYYQAKSIKLAVLLGGNDMLDALGKQVNPDRLAKAEKYQSEMKAIEETGHELEHSSEAHMVRHVSLARAVTGFQIAIAMSAIAVLAKRPKLWLLSLAIGIAGTVFMVLGLI
jgi:uncharacterized protein DUF4337